MAFLKNIWVNCCTYSLTVFCKYLYLLTQAQSTLCTGSLLCLVTADILLSFYLSGNQTTACSLATCPTYATDVPTGKTSLTEEKTDTHVVAKVFSRTFAFIEVLASKETAINCLCCRQCGTRDGRTNGRTEK